MKAAKITIKVLILLLTSVFGLVCGVLVPLMLLSDEYFAVMHGLCAVWLFMSVPGFFIPCFMVMLNFSKIAAGCSVIGTVMTLYIHVNIAEYFTASFMYLPQIFMTILTVLFIFVTNPQFLSGYRQKQTDKLNASAPSILDRKE